jgi:hypothetical protein
MKRIVLSIVAVAALSLGGLFTATAEAHGPHHGYRCVPPRYSYGYGAYTGYSPYNVYRSMCLMAQATRAVGSRIKLPSRGSAFIWATN